MNNYNAYGRAWSSDFESKEVRRHLRLALFGRNAREISASIRRAKESARKAWHYAVEIEKRT